MRDNSGWFCFLHASAAMTSHRPHRSIPLALAAFLGTFLLVPLWDVYALAIAVRAEGQARPATESPLLRAARTPTLRKLIVLAAAYALAWLGFGALGRLIAQPGPFGVLATGLANLPALAAGPCCDVSTAVVPGQPAGALVAARLLPTLALLAVATVLAGLLIALLTGAGLALRRLSGRLGGVLSLMGWLASSVLAAPAGAVMLLVVLVLGVRLGLIPPGGGAAWAGLLAAGLVVAMLPALLAARAALHTRSDDPALLALTAGHAFFTQAGWLISSAIAVEVVAGREGLGALLVEALRLGDAAVAIRAVQILAPLLLVMGIRAAANAGVRGTLATVPTPRQDKRTPARLRIGLAALVILAPLALAALWLPHHADAPDPAAIYERPSAAHPLGTDHLGRDVRGQVGAAVVNSWGTALTAGLVALGFGGLWGVASAALDRRGATGPLLAEVLMLPARAATLAHAPLVALLLLAATGEAGADPVLWLGAAVGLVLAPRTALAVRAAGEQHGTGGHGAALALFAVDSFAALHYSQIILTLALGASAAASLGGLLARHAELIAGAQVVMGGGYLRLAATLAMPGIAVAAGSFLLQDALTARFAPRQTAALIQVLN